MLKKTFSKSQTFNHTKQLEMFSRVSSSAVRALSVAAKVSPSNLVSEITVTVKNAGSKTGAAGLAHVLASSTFLDSTSKSALRLKRESELLGGEYSAYVTRDDLVLKATFLKDSLPFFVNSLGAALAEASYKPHELIEIALPYAKYTSATANSCPSFKALEELHAVSFRSGLGKPLYYDGSKTFTIGDVTTFAKNQITSENITIEAVNVNEVDLNKFVAESPFSKIPAGNAVIAQSPKTYTGAETRIRQAGATSAVIGVPAADAAKVESLASSLASLEFNATVKSGVLPYEGASLFYFSATSPDAGLVSEAVKTAVKTAGVKDFNFVVVGDVDSVPLKAEL